MKINKKALFGIMASLVSILVGLLLGLILNPIIIASDACAKTISLSVTVPIPLLITLTLIPSTSSFNKEFLTASSLPLTSAFKTILISFSP